MRASSSYVSAKSLVLLPFTKRAANFFAQLDSFKAEHHDSVATLKFSLVCAATVRNLYDLFPYLLPVLHAISLKAAAP